MENYLNEQTLNKQVLATAKDIGNTIITLEQYLIHDIVRVIINYAFTTRSECNLECLTMKNELNSSLLFSSHFISYPPRIVSLSVQNNSCLINYYLVKEAFPTSVCRVIYFSYGSKYVITYYKV